MTIKLITKYTPWLFLLTAIITGFRHTYSNPFSTTVCYAIYSFFIYIAFRWVLYNRHRIDRTMTLYIFYFIWIIICIIRGFLVADNYWEYKNCYNNSLALLLPIISTIFIIPQFCNKILRTYFKWCIPLSLLCLPFFLYFSWYWYFYPFIALVVLFPAIKHKWLYLIFTGFICFLDIYSRSPILKFIAAICCGYLVYLSYPVKYYLCKYITILVYVLSMTLLILGITGVFNIFKMDEYLPSDMQKDKNLIEDTRTWIYTEVITSAYNNDYIVWGRTPARGFDTTFNIVLENIETMSQMTKDKVKSERFGCEINFLNIFTWTGLLGVILLSLIYIRASFIALLYSNNSYIKVLGLYIAFRFLYGWIEDITSFDSNSLTLWLLISFCLSPFFRQMNNSEFKQFVKYTICLNHK